MILKERRAFAAGVSFIVLGALAFGCSSPDDSERAEALFEVPRASGEGDFYALPYPNDIRVGADGLIDLSAHPRPNPLTELYLDAISENQRGFSLNAPAFFRFSVPINPASLPAQPVDATRTSSSVFIVNIQEGSDRFGELVPVRVRFETRDGSVIGENWLSVLPFPGFPLEEGATHAAVVTERIQGANDVEILPAEDFLAIRDGTPTEPALVAAQAAYQPLWSYLDGSTEIDREGVVSAAVFTTQNATALMNDIRDVIYRDTADPTPRDFTLITTTADFNSYEGAYDGPVFQSGTVPYARPEMGGNIEFDAAGDPLLQGMVELRFALTVPLGAAPAGGWPVVIYAHGTGGSYRSFINNGTARALAQQGLAAISIDQVLHGPRNPNGDPEIDFFNFQNPLSARDNTLQGALDDFQLARLVVLFDETVGPDTITFDDQRIYFFGHSQGGLTGLPFVAYEPLVKGAVFSGAGGNIGLSLLNKTEPIDIAGLVSIIIRDTPLDEFNPMLGLIQGYLDRSDSVNFGPLIISRPPSGRQPIDVFHSLGLTDNFTPVPSIKALATSLAVAPLNPLLEPIEGLELRELDPVTAPVTSNLGGVTGVVAQYNQAAGSDGHFVLFDIPLARAQSVQFLGTLSNNGAATIVVE